MSTEYSNVSKIHYTSLSRQIIISRAFSKNKTHFRARKKTKTSVHVLTKICLLLYMDIFFNYNIRNKVSHLVSQKKV